MKKLILALSLFITAICTGFSQSNFQIIFNAGTGVLAGEDTVWMYAGVGIGNPGNFWNYSVGELIQPGTGIGKMTSVGQNVWGICFEPFAYFSQGPGGPIPGGSTIYNLSMLFHNTDFSAQVNVNDNSVPLNITMQPSPVSNWVLVTGSFQNCTLGEEEFFVSGGTLSNYPNPVKQNTVFIYTLKNPGVARINIFNAVGQKINQLVNEKKGTGMHSFEWNCTNEKGYFVKDGMYFYNLEVDGKVIQTNKLVIAKK